MIDVELALAKQKRSTLEAHLTATEQRAERAEAELAVVLALLRETDEMLVEAIVCGSRLCKYMPLRTRIVATLAGEKSNGLS